MLVWWVFFGVVMVLCLWCFNFWCRLRIDLMVLLFMFLVMCMGVMLSCWNSGFFCVCFRVILSVVLWFGGFFEMRLVILVFVVCVIVCNRESFGLCLLFLIKFSCDLVMLICVLSLLRVNLFFSW